MLKLHGPSIYLIKLNSLFKIIRTVLNFIFSNLLYTFNFINILYIFKNISLMSNYFKIVKEIKINIIIYKMYIN